MTLWPQFARRGSVQQLGISLLNLMLPRACAACDVSVMSGPGFCPDCWAELKLISPQLTDWQGMPLPFAHSAGRAGNAVYASGERLGFRAAAPYGEVAARVVQRLKYQDRQDLASPMAHLMTFAGRDLLNAADLLVPVPLHRARLRSRRFNQAALLANLLKRGDKARLSHDLVARVRPTRQQVGLSQAARLQNMRGAFALVKNAADYVADKRVVLVDDVITTGATARACARVFLDAGAARVDVLAFARVVYDDKSVNAH